jgi:hypothetical protein
MATSPANDRRNGKPVVILDPDDGTPMIIMPVKPTPPAGEPSSQQPQNSPNSAEK